MSFNTPPEPRDRASDVIRLIVVVVLIFVLAWLFGFIDMPTGLRRTTL